MLGEIYLFIRQLLKGDILERKTCWDWKGWMSLPRELGGVIVSGSN